MMFAMTSKKRFALPDSNRRMFVTAVSSTANVLLKSLFMTQRMHIVYVNHDCLKAGQVLCAMSLTWQESMH